MKLQSIELRMPDPESATHFLVDIWGMAETRSEGPARYLRGSGPLPYLVAIEPGPEAVLSITFRCSEADVDRIRATATSAGLRVRETVSSEPGGGEGIIVTLPEGEHFRFLSGGASVEPLEGRDLPVQLTHVVLNAADAEASGAIVEKALGFRVSDRTKGMVFVRCNDSHHSTAFARAGFSSLNHIAFEMQDLDAVMRGIGRLRDHRLQPSWGPGRHGPGDNAFAYFIAPFGAVVEFSTAVEKVPDDYRVGSPADWTWPEGRIDQWGLSDKDSAALRVAEERFRFIADER